MLIFTCEHYSKPVRANFDAHRKAFLASKNGSFMNWYRYPNYHMSKGCIIATAWEGDVPVAVCIVKFSYSYGKSLFGFFTKSAYRRQGLAKKLGKIAITKFDEISDNKFIVADARWTWESAYYICKNLGLEVSRLYNYS